MSEFEELKGKVRQCLKELKGKSKTVSALNSRYVEKYGTFIPYKNYGFSTLIEFLVSIPDVVQVTQSGTSLDGVKLTAVVPGKKKVVPITEKTTTGATNKIVEDEPKKQVLTATLSNEGKAADLRTDTVRQGKIEHKPLEPRAPLMTGLSVKLQREIAAIAVIGILKRLETLGLTGSQVGSSGPTSGQPVADRDPSIKSLSNVEGEELLKKKEGENKEEEQADLVPVDPAKVLPPFEHKNIAPTANELHTARKELYGRLIGSDPNTSNMLGCNTCRNSDVLGFSCPNCGRILRVECEDLPSYGAVSHTSSAQASGSHTTSNRSEEEKKGDAVQHVE